MSQFQNYKKAELVAVLKKLDVHTLTKDTKKVLVEKLDLYAATHEGGAEAAQTILDENEELAEEATLAEDEDAEDAEDDDDEEEEVDDKLNTSIAKAELSEDDDEESDPDFKAPPVNLKQWIVDPLVDWSEHSLSKIYDFTDAVGITYLEYSDILREQLSTTVTLNFLELVGEAAFFLHSHVPWVALKHNTLNHQVFKDNSAFFSSSTLPTPQVSALFALEPASIFVLWVLTAILLPLLVSYYVNFSRRVLVFDGAEGIVGRIYSYDPFIFALTKVLIYYFISLHVGPLTSLHSLSGLWYSVQNFVLIHWSLYGNFLVTFGNIPIVIGIANAAIALYSQFEDY